jgi:PEP-CTERM motif
MKSFSRSLALLGIFLGSVASVCAQQIYVATGGNGTNGSIYTFDTTSGSQTSVHSLTVSGNPIGITGLAFSPSTQMLYGVTVSNNITSLDRSLVTIDPNTGNATLVGSLNTIVADISFTPDGTLYGFTGGSSTTIGLVTISLSTGATSAVIGSSGLDFSYGGGLASNSSGTLYLSATGSANRPSNTDFVGELDTINKTTGTRTFVASLSGSSFPGEDISTVNPALGALAFDNSGTLWGSNSDRKNPANVQLVTINLVTGAITNHFTLPQNTDAIAFSPIPEPSTISFFFLGGLGVVGLAVRRGRR